VLITTVFQVQFSKVQQEAMQSETILIQGGGEKTVKSVFKAKL